MKVAVLGAGRMGRRHVQAARDLGLTIAGVCDRSEAALKAASEQQGVPPSRLYGDPKELLRKEKPECVIVATTAPGHCPLTCLAAEAGACYILCEKPMGVSLAECDRMIGECERRGARLAVNHQMRFVEHYLAVQRVIESAAFGGWTSITVVAGNIGLAMNGTHYFELLRWLSGEPAAEVSAWLSWTPVPNPRGPEFKDPGGSVRASTASGKRLYMEIGADQGHGVRVVYAGRNGVVVADELAGKVWVSARSPEDRALPTTRYGTPAVGQEIRVPPADDMGPSRAVLNALITGDTPPTGSDGRHAVAVLVAAYQSHDQGHVPVRVDDGLDRERVFPWA